MDQLAARLGAQAQEQKVGEYYHRMEQGLLPAAGVSDTVLDALGRIVGWTAEALRKRRAQLPAAGPAARATRARCSPAPTAASRRSARPIRAPTPPAGEWDEVDRLFRGAPPSA